MTRKERIRAEHEAALRKLGVKNFKRTNLKGSVSSPLTTTTLTAGVHTKTSDKIPANGSKKQRHKITTNKIVGLAYNKGPIMVLSSKEDLKAAQRRDR